MQNESVHISDEELLLTADGELSSRRAAEVHAHLVACWDCRTRMADLERAIGDFVRTYHQTIDPQLTSAEGPRALLKAQLAQMSNDRNPESGLFRFFAAKLELSYVAIALAVILTGVVLVRHFDSSADRSRAGIVEREVVPNRRLTPGSTKPVTVRDVCSMVHEEVVRPVSPLVRQAVLREYGIDQTRSGNYEIDYLIAPGLGGTEDIQNLWPEPYAVNTWNAHVKDALEERLHELVCTGKLDLNTAQSDIADDWIAAYKKYFNTDTPFPESAAIVERKDCMYSCKYDSFAIFRLRLF